MTGYNLPGGPLEPWESRARCAEPARDAQDWTANEDAADYSERTARAKATCMTCPVRMDCLEWATRTQQHHGVLGGLTSRERAEHAKGARRAHQEARTA